MRLCDYCYLHNEQYSNSPVQTRVVLVTALEGPNDQTELLNKFDLCKSCYVEILREFKAIIHRKKLPPPTPPSSTGNKP